MGSVASSSRPASMADDATPRRRSQARPPGIARTTNSTKASPTASYSSASYGDDFVVQATGVDDSRADIQGQARYASVTSRS